ncbi:hypothetical protein H8958_000139 [Nasalis larvatus]
MTLEPGWLAIFGVGFGSPALLQNVVDENGCCLLYVVEDQLCGVERAFRAEHLANTSVVREQDADIVLNDQREGGALQEAAEFELSGCPVLLRRSRQTWKAFGLRILQVRGSQGALQMENQNPLGITGQGTSLSLGSQTQTSRYQDLYRELFRHFVRTLKGKEPPEIAKEQFLRAFRVATAAAQSWWSRSAVDLPCDSAEASVVKTEAL